MHPPYTGSNEAHDTTTIPTAHCNHQTPPTPPLHSANGPRGHSSSQARGPTRKGQNMPATAVPLPPRYRPGYHSTCPGHSDFHGEECKPWPPQSQPNPLPTQPRQQSTRMTSLQATNNTQSQVQRQPCQSITPRMPPPELLTRLQTSVHSLGSGIHAVPFLPGGDATLTAPPQ